MKKYIKIGNAGEIERNAFKLIGASSKRNDNTKIGFFGSGLKYAMAFLLREEIGFKIFSGVTEVKVTTRPVSHRNQEFQVIQVDGDDTSMTTEMGPKWTHWGAVREIYCNAVDEGHDTITIVNESDAHPEQGTTIFFVELTADLTQIVDNWDEYFSKNRKDIVYSRTFGYGAGTIFWSKSSEQVNDMIVYRKGIQCYMSPNTPSCYHYDFPWIEINESREISSMYNFKCTLVNFFAKEVDSNTLRILLSNMDRGLAKFEFDLDWSGLYQINGVAWIEAIGSMILVPAEIAGWYSEIIDREGREKYWLLPNYMVSYIQRHLPEIKVLGENVGGVVFCKLTPTEKHTFLLNEVSKFFDEAKYSISYPIHVVKFESSYIYGHAKADNIYISEKVFDLGKRKLAETIYEENEHLKTGFADETRDLQDHLIGQVISRMEEKHAFFL